MKFGSNIRKFWTLKRWRTQTLFKNPRKNLSYYANKSNFLKFYSKKGAQRDLSFFLAGFFVGEGSLWVSVNKSKHSGVQLNFGFSIYQHKVNIVYLELFFFYFQTGRIEKKSGSSEVYQFVINSRISLIQKVKPFILNYCNFFGSKKDYFLFFEILEGVEISKEHLSKEGLRSLIQKVYLMESLKGKKRKRTLKEVLSMLDEN